MVIKLNRHNSKLKQTNQFNGQTQIFKELATTRRQRQRPSLPPIGHTRECLPHGIGSIQRQLEWRFTIQKKETPCQRYEI